MNTRRFFLKVSVLVTALITALAMAAPPVTTQAAATIVVDDDTIAGDCGKYDDGSPEADPGAAMVDAPTGSTVIICPGTYSLTGSVLIIDKKLTVKRALTGPGSRPMVATAASTGSGIIINNSTVTFDGLIIDASGTSGTNNIAVIALNSSVTIRNSTIRGSRAGGSSGIYSQAVGAAKAYNLSITNSTIVGYGNYAVWVQGAVKLNVSSCHLDASDGGLVSDAMYGIWFDGSSPGPVGATGAVTRSRIIGSYYGISIQEASKVSVTNNVLADTQVGVHIYATGGARSADNNKITGNTFLGIPSSGVGVWVANADAANYTINKFTISKNVFVADRYGSTAEGVRIGASVPGTPNVSGSITSNTFIGISTYLNTIVSGPFPGVKEKGSDAQP